MNDNNKENTATKGTTTAIKALSVILEEGENNKGVNEKGKKVIRRALKLARAVKVDMLDVLVDRVERALGAPGNTEMCNRNRSPPIWVKITAGKEMLVKPVHPRMVHELVISRKECDNISKGRLNFRGHSHTSK